MRVLAVLLLALGACSPISDPRIGQCSEEHYSKVTYKATDTVHEQWTYWSAVDVAKFPEDEPRFTVWLCNWECMGESCETPAGCPEGAVCESNGNIPPTSIHDCTTQSVPLSVWGHIVVTCGSRTRTTVNGEVTSETGGRYTTYSVRVE